MRLFRVRGIAEVEPSLAFQRLDLIAYVPVGGTNRSYISVSRELANPSLKEGKIERAAYVIDQTRPESIILVPEFTPVENTPEELADIEKDNNLAFILVPSGAFNFGDPKEASPVRVGKMVCRAIILAPGEQISAFPVCHSISEMDAAKRATLAFDGENVTFTHDQ